MAKRKSRANADTEELDRFAAGWAQRFSPENVTTLRNEILRKASPARRKHLEKLAALAKEPREDARTEFTRAFGKVDTGEKRNALSRLLYEFAQEIASGQVGLVVRFMWDARKKGPTAGGKESGYSRKKEADTWHARCEERARELLSGGRSRRELAGILAPQFDVSAKTIRDVLKKANVK